MNILLVYKKSTYLIYFRERGLTAEVRHDAHSRK